MNAQELNNNKTLLKIIQSLASPVFIKDRSHRWVLVNQALCDLIGVPEEELIGKSDYDFFPKEQADIFWEKDNQVFINKIVNVNQEEITVANGETLHLETKKMVFHDEQLGDVLCGVITDITELKNYQSKINHANKELSIKVEERTKSLKVLNQKLKLMAFEDRLTGLKNRSGFDLLASEGIEKAKQNNSTIAFIFLDMDGLKFVNDSYGHPVGDLLIQQAGERLDNIIGSKGVVGRIGGDEFLIMISYSDIMQVHEIAQEISSKMQKPAQVIDKTIPLGCSIGIACYPNHGKDWVSLFQNADCAMYVAKENKKGSYEFYQKRFTDQTKRKFELETELRKAIFNKQVKAEFQPIIDCSSQKTIGYEALARWNDAEFGQVSPIEFIAIAEESGLIVELGQQILEQSIQFISKHCKSKEYVSVNVSSVQLNAPDFGIMLQQLIKTYQITPAQLAIEVTESVLMKANQSLTEIIKSFNLQGIRIFVDDFGTGYSNFMQLRKLKFDTLKIDSDFTKNIVSSDFDRSLLKAISVMANDIGLDVIAEGIENEAQRQCLIDLGIPLAQGYLWSPSQPVSYWMNKNKST